VQGLFPCFVTFSILFVCFFFLFRSFQKIFFASFLFIH
jgi:hypothetical protein